MWSLDFVRFWPVCGVSQPTQKIQKDMFAPSHHFPLFFHLSHGAQEGEGKGFKEEIRKRGVGLGLLFLRYQRNGNSSGNLFDLPHSSLCLIFNAWPTRPYLNIDHGHRFESLTLDSTPFPTTVTLEVKEPTQFVNLNRQRPFAIVRNRSQPLDHISSTAFPSFLIFDGPLKWLAKSHSHLYVVLATNLESSLIDSSANGRRIRSIQRIATARFPPLDYDTRNDRPIDYELADGLEDI
ncbi:hypothetical protein NA56DRAFT_754937 [Hyaloscypha hepaticicola]|uniref:Uncharacterized protein n=1 Tax=Hyaloscypha hepaticicola TaxID=2082293 RepID=A0A2J6PJL5_9HELO|nr:hypothetical protein NA56DRAFT_754937 [Hyaloscypha hepaticicola]